jgi:hypothetical protein
MFRQRSSGNTRQARRRGAWAAGLAVLAGCGAVILAVHFATAPNTLDAVSSSNVTRAHQAGFLSGGQAADHDGYGRGGYPMMPHTAANAAETTMNWAGYATAGTAGTFTSVSTSWTQPSVTCGGTDTFSSFWAGLDGDGTPTVEQTGTEADCQDGTAVYSGWYEAFPNAPVFYNEPVQPGDAMSASVTANGGGSFALTLTDTTQNWTQTTNQTVANAELGSAEVIAEAPSSQTVLPLADFGTVNFSDVTVNGQPIGGDNPDSLTMVSNNGTPEATPSALTGQNSFSVTFDGGNASPAPATGTPGTGTGTPGTGTGTPGTGRHHHHHDIGQG